MRSIPAFIVPFRMIRAKYFVLRTLPVIASFNPMVLIECNRRNLLRLWLRMEVRVLRFDLLHLLRFGLLRFGPHIRLCVLLNASRSWRSCTGFSQGVLPTLLPLLNLLLLPDLRRHSCRMTGNIRSGRGRICRFLMSPTLPAFSSTGLSRRFTGRFSGEVRIWGVRRLVGRVSFLALFRARLIRSSALIDRSVFLHRALLLLRTWGVRLRSIRSGLCFSGMRFFGGALAL